jgi:hypothetical protein
MTNKLRCRLGKHRWRCRGRGDALTYFCQACGKTRDKPPRRTGGAEAPVVAWSWLTALSPFCAECRFEA